MSCRDLRHVRHDFLHEPDLLSLRVSFEPRGFFLGQRSVGGCGHAHGGEPLEGVADDHFSAGDSQHWGGGALGIYSFDRQFRHSRHHRGGSVRPADTDLFQGKRLLGLERSFLHSGGECAHNRSRALVPEICGEPQGVRDDFGLPCGDSAA